jgi:hypothetical protein
MTIDPKQFKQWLELRRRLLSEERAYARERSSGREGTPSDFQNLSVKESEIRALRALSRSLLHKSLGSTVPGDRDGKPSPGKGAD